jgi:hypothetical protein
MGSTLLINPLTHQMGLRMRPNLMVSLSNHGQHTPHQPMNAPNRPQDETQRHGEPVEPWASLDRLGMRLRDPPHGEPVEPCD